MKKFPKGHIFAAMTMVLCSLAVIFALDRQYTLPAATVESASIVACSSEPGHKYEVRLWKNAVCVFSKDGALLIKTGINPSGLRLADAKTLEEGILLADFEQVMLLLEDFGS